MPDENGEIIDLGPMFEENTAGALVPCESTLAKCEAIEKFAANPSEPIPRELLKAVAWDIGKEVAHHIKIMYPEAVKAASSTFLLSVKGCVCNEIMAAIDSEQDVVARMAFRDKFRRYIENQYRKIRRAKS